MRTIKFISIIICLVVYLIIGLITRLFLMRAKPYVFVKCMNHFKYYLMWMFKLIGGLRVVVLGQTEILKEKGLFIISTHVGYLDGVILGSVVRGSFTTKEEIKKVPLLGKVVSIGNSIFINRKEKNKIINYVTDMADRLEQGINIFNFPEGHATDGTKILSFFPAFFDGPLKTNAPIVPITINYEKIDGLPIKNRSDVYCYDGCTVLKHLWNLMKFKRIDITVEVHDKIKTNGFGSDRAGRKAVSDLCIKRLSSYKNLPISNDHPLKRPSVNRSRRAAIK